MAKMLGAQPKNGKIEGTHAKVPFEEATYVSGKKLNIPIMPGY
jgi:hypothetical protein